jgi:hypothetical protein
MYTLLRIEGEDDRLQELLSTLREELCDLNAEITGRGDLSVDLSRQEEWEAHQDEIEARLPNLRAIVANAISRGCSAYLDSAVYVPPPDGVEVAVTVRAYRLCSALMGCLSEMGLSYEFTVYVEPADDSLPDLQPPG